MERSLVDLGGWPRNGEALEHGCSLVSRHSVALTGAIVKQGKTGMKKDSMMGNVPAFPPIKPCLAAVCQARCSC